MDLLKIQVKNPVLQLKGDHAANLVFEKVKRELVRPYLNLDIEEVDLSLKNRYFTSDKIMQDTILLLRKIQVAVKCATNDEDKMYTPCSTMIKKQIKGTTIRRPIIFNDMQYNMSHWKKPITIISHNENDLYQNISKRVQKNSKVYIKIVTESGEEEHELLQSKNKDGVCALFFNEVQSIEKFARTSMKYALLQRQPLYLSTKNTILKQYDGTYKQIFQNIYEKEFKDKFEKASIFYQHRLIDDMVAYMMKSEGGYIWACKQYDSENLSCLIAEGFGSQSLMTSIVVTDDGLFMSEPVHGTYKEKYKQILNGEKCTVNPIASIFCWTRALNQRGLLDQNEQLQIFCNQLEQATLNAVKKNKLVEDMTTMNKTGNILNTDEFIQHVKSELYKIRSKLPKLQIIQKNEPVNKNKKTKSKVWKRYQSTSVGISLPHQNDDG